MICIEMKNIVWYSIFNVNFKFPVMAKKMVINEGCVGCLACVSGLSDSEKQIIDKFMKLGDDGLMRSTDGSTDDPGEIELMEKVVGTCPMGVMEVVDV